MQSARSLASGLQAVKAEPALSARPVTGGPTSRRDDEGFWVAVAPFRFSGAHGELSALSDGLTEEIIAGLSRFTYLRVLTKGTTGARYVLEGSLRQAGTQLRVAVKLIDTSTGANLWAENYTRAYSPDTIFDVQDDLVPTIVSTIAESTGGVLTHSMWLALRDREPASLTPYEAMIRSNGFYETLSHDEYVRAVALLKRVIEREPNHAGCLAQLSRVYSNGHQIGWGEDENLLDVSQACAQRAIATEPSSSFAHGALAYVQYGRRDLAGFHNAAERALALNPFDGVAMATIGHGFAYSGEWQRGCELIERAMKLNPRHPGWYWYPLVHNAYRLRDYERALDCALRVNLPEQFWTPAVLAMAHAQLGNHALASKAVRDLLALKPGFESSARQELERWFFEPGYVEHVLDGWRKAGLKVS
jgi:TolB-like protein